jgi:hypothetical protein
MTPHETTVFQALLLMQMQVFAIDEILENRDVHATVRNRSEQLREAIIKKQRGNFQVLWDIGDQEGDLRKHLEEYDHLLKLIVQLGPDKVNLVAKVCAAAISDNITYEIPQ